MDWTAFLKGVFLVAGGLVGILYLYQILYTAVGFLLSPSPTMFRKRVAPKRYAALIAARNEEGVIGELIESLKAQNYPSGLLDIYVVADNCTDATARAATLAGAKVYVRHDHAHVGKGYALDYLWKHLRESGLEAKYAGYFVFDADNLVDPDFVHEMDRTFQEGDFVAVTGYRNSKNFGQNWITAGYSLWFLREARFVNAARMALGVSCAVSGTGFLVNAEILREYGGWPWHLLTEDAQFSAEMAARGRRIGYCDAAVVYDEQPASFAASWAQRKRWSKGFFQICSACGPRLWRGLSQGGRKGFGCYDLLTKYAQGALTLALGAVLLLAAVTACVATPVSALPLTAALLGRKLLTFYGGTLFLGLLTVVSEWDRIPATRAQKLGYLLTLPLFIATYLPITVAALLQPVERTPIKHNPTSFSKPGLAA